MAITDDKTISNPPIPLCFTPLYCLPTQVSRHLNRMLLLMGAGVVVLVVLVQGHVTPFLDLPLLCSTRG